MSLVAPLSESGAQARGRYTKTTGSRDPFAFRSAPSLRFDRPRPAANPDFMGRLAAMVGLASVKTAIASTEAA